MIDRIIWKVLLIIGGIVGSIISITKLPAGYDDLNSWQNFLQHAQKYDYDRSSIIEIETKISEAETYFYMWSAVLIISVIIFIVGCTIKTDSNNLK